MKQRNILDISDRTFFEFKDGVFSLTFEGGYEEMNAQELYDWLGKVVLNVITQPTHPTKPSDLGITIGPQIPANQRPSPIRPQDGLEILDLSKNINKAKTAFSPANLNQPEKL